MARCPSSWTLHDDLGDVTEEDILAAHKRDLELQDKHGVQFLTYWSNSPDGHAFCLVSAPTKNAAIACHKESHGLVPHKVIEIALKGFDEPIRLYEVSTSSGHHRPFSARRQAAR